MTGTNLKIKNFVSLVTNRCLFTSYISTDKMLQQEHRAGYFSGPSQKSVFWSKKLDHIALTLFFYKKTRNPESGTIKQKP